MSLTKKEIMQEIVRCGRDPVYFTNTYARISEPMRGLIPFDLYDFQKQALNDFTKHRFSGVYPKSFENYNISSNEIFNIGRGRQVDLMHFINRIGIELNRKPDIIKTPPHPADVIETWSNTSKIEKIGYQPVVDIEEGVAEFVSWYKDYHEVN